MVSKLKISTKIQLFFISLLGKIGLVMKMMIVKIFTLFNKVLEYAERENTKLVLKRAGQVDASVKPGKNTFLQIQPKIKKLIIEENVSWKDNNAIRIYNGAEFIMRKNTYFSDRVSINCLDKIEIGENSWIGEGSKLYDHNHKYVTEPEYEWKIREFDTAPIIIGKNVKIYSDVTILKGVTIGDNCIIGAKCTIYKDIPPYSIVINKTENIIKPILK
ncbi:acyltransferase [Riemerella columbina]|uniref:acyltransferase n=1 Tax=Riemerella columbina TaxID=103810 RepID=UPI00266F76B8|nr:acyltransferase [Riemerella columbina]WKS95142.1 acyltransferase [Riemerella columbina]